MNRRGEDRVPRTCTCALADGAERHACRDSRAAALAGAIGSGLSPLPLRGGHRFDGLWRRSGPGAPVRPHPAAQAVNGQGDGPGDGKQARESRGDLGHVDHLMEREGARLCGGAGCRDQAADAGGALAQGAILHSRRGCVVGTVFQARVRAPTVPATVTGVRPSAESSFRVSPAARVQVARSGAASAACGEERPASAGP